MKYLTLAAALCAVAPACAQPNSAGWSAGDADDSLPLVQPRQLVPQPSPWPVLAPYPRTTASPPYTPQPAPDFAEQQIRQLEQHNRLLMLQFQQRIYEDALRLPRR